MDICIVVNEPLKTLKLVMVATICQFCVCVAVFTVKKAI